MEKKYFSLSSVENNKLIKIIQIVFGVVCIGIAAYWSIFNFNSFKASKTIWVTVLFLTGFGFYEIWSGIGKAARYISIETDKIMLKKTILLPVVELAATGIERIEIFPFNLKFFLKTDKKINLRLSSTYFETNEKIKDELIGFAESNNIPVEEIEEKI